MHKKNQPLSPGQLSVMSLSIIAAMAAMAPTVVQAACITLSSNATVTGPTSTCLTWRGGNLSLTNNGTLNGPSSPQVEATGSLAGTLTNRGLISGGSIGVLNSGTISVVNNNGGRITGTGVALSGAAGSSIGTLTNTGRITGTTSGISLGSGARITSLFNNVSGTLTGTISGQTAILSSGGTIGSLTNAGLISATYAGVHNGNASTISSLLNSGTISGTTYGILADNGSSITSLTNAGLISGSTNVGVSISANGTIASLVNTGTISGALGGISNAGRINALSNSGTLGPISNTGLIAGTIANLSSRDITISGGSGTIFGTITGVSGGIGSADVGGVTGTLANLVFSSGNQLLNSNINVGSNAVTNAGSTLQVNNSISITGNYVQSAGAALVIGVANGATATGSLSDTGYGKLIVSGAATVASGSSITLQKLSSYGFAAGQRFVVIDALTAGTNYNASTLNYSAVGSTGLTVSGATVVNGSRSDLVVSLSSPSSATSGATAPNANSALTGLGNYTGVSNAGLLNLYNASMALNSSGSIADLNNAGKQLNPNTQAPAGYAAAAPTYDVLNIINRHSDGLRLSQAHGTGLSTGEGPSQLGGWGQAFGGRASQDQRDQVDGYSANYGGLLAGLDGVVSDNWRVGGIFSYSNANADNSGNTSGNSTKIDSYGLFGYGSYVASNWYANVAAGVVLQNYNSTRAINFSGFSGNATGSFMGQQYVLRGEAGYPIPMGDYTVTPVGGLTYSDMHQDGYTESGGNGAALSVKSSSTSSVTSDIGAKLEREFATSYGVLVPELRLAWRHEYVNDRARSTSSFAGDPTGQTSFTSLGASPVQDSALLSIGLTLLKSNDLTLTVRYDGQMGGGYQSNAGSVRVRKLF